MRPFNQAIIALIALGFVVLPHTNASETNPKLVTLIEQSGINAVIDFIPQQIQAQVTQIKITEEDPEIAEQLGSIMLKHMSSEQLREKFYILMSSSLDNNLIDLAIAIINKFLVKRIIKAEINASDLANQAEMLSYISNLTNQQPSTQRIQLIQTIESVSHSSEIIGMMLQKVMVGMTSVFDLPEADEAQVKKEVQQMVESQLKPQILLQYHYVYHTFSDHELKDYIEILKTEDYQKFIVITLAGISQILVDAFKNVASDLKKLSDAKAA